MIVPEVEQVAAVAVETIPASPQPAVFSDREACAGGPSARDKWDARHALALHRAETERLRVLVDFLARPIHAHGGAEPDPDIVTAYNLAVEAALRGIRQGTLSTRG